MQKYTEVVTQINPMDTAPTWGYYGGDVETTELFYRWWGETEINSVIGYYDRPDNVWRDHYTGLELCDVELLGWLPTRDYVSLTGQ